MRVGTLAKSFLFFLLLMSHYYDHGLVWAAAPAVQTVVEHKVGLDRLDGSFSFTAIFLVLSIAEFLFILYLLKQRMTDGSGGKTEQDRLDQLAYQKNQLEYQALYDPLTQLPNRRLFRNRLLTAIKDATRHNATFGVMMADLDHFKEVNDTMGHDAGDQLLLEVTNRLRKELRDSDTLARLGGDEFAFICPGIHDIKTTSVICMRIIQALAEPIVIRGQSFKIGISLGVAFYPSHALDEDLLVRKADRALYKAKEKRNVFVIFNDERAGEF